MPNEDRPDLTLLLDILWFDIIDGKRGEKADPSPLTRDSRYREAFGRRIRHWITWPGVEPFDAWCARPRFPFRFTIGVNRLRKSEWFEVHRQGAGWDMVKVVRE